MKQEPVKPEYTPQIVYCNRNNRPSFELAGVGNTQIVVTEYILSQVLAFQKCWWSISHIIVCILAHCMLPF